MSKTVAQRGRGLHGQVVQQLGQMIVAGEFDSQQPLVPEEIGQNFEVSRTVVRESLRVLEAKGLVSARPNVGTRVRPVSDWNLLDPDVIDWRAHGPQRQEQMRELLELRLAVEPLGARLAAQRGSHETWTVLSHAVQMMRETAERGDSAAFSRVHVEFHRVLLEAGGNRMLHHLAGMVSVALRMRDEYFQFDGDSCSDQIEGHGRLVDAITDGDVEGAESLARLLIEGKTAGVPSPLSGSRSPVFAHGAVLN